MMVTGAAVGLLLDTGHLTFAGGDVAGTARRPGERINHVHCKDVRPEVLRAPRAGALSFLNGVIEGVFTVPGDGCIDFRAFCRVLNEIGYERLGRRRGRAGSEEGATRSRCAGMGFAELTEACRRRA